MAQAAPHRLLVLGTAVAALLLLVTAPSPAASLRTLADAGSATDQAAPLVALLSLVAWLLAAWLVLVLVVTAGGHLPGRAGRALAAAARRLAPAGVRRTLEVALGLTVAVGVLGASPAAAAPGPAGPAAPAGVSLDWAAPAAPGLDWGSAAPTTPSSPDATAPALDLDWAVDTVGAATPAPAATPVDSAAADAGVVVQPGDSLWALAEQDLAARGESATDAAVAQAWPTWWAANRDAVGDDPDLLQPGTRLAPPDDSTPPASS